MERVYIALLHYPVRQGGRTISSSITNLDIHDLARLAATYGLGAYYLVHPDDGMRGLAAEFLSHWFDGAGRLFKPDRTKALEKLVIVRTLDEAIADIEKREGERPFLLATSAALRPKTVTLERIGKLTKNPLLVLFGTADGISEELDDIIDGYAEPIDSGTGYNHLSVRSAASIFIDRLHRVK
mgnify:CR=1 FL=1